VCLLHVYMHIRTSGWIENPPYWNIQACIYVYIYTHIPKYVRIWIYAHWVHFTQKHLHTYVTARCTLPQSYTCLPHWRSDGEIYQQREQFLWGTLNHIHTHIIPASSNSRVRCELPCSTRYTRRSCLGGIVARVALWQFGHVSSRDRRIGLHAGELDR
jgi:hypothetical protein